MPGYRAVVCPTCQGIKSTKSDKDFYHCGRKFPIKDHLVTRLVPQGDQTATELPPDEETPRPAKVEKPAPASSEGYEELKIER